MNESVALCFLFFFQHQSRRRRPFYSLSCGAPAVRARRDTNDNDTPGPGLPGPRLSAIVGVYARYITSVVLEREREIERADNFGRLLRKKQTEKEKAEEV